MERREFVQLSGSMLLLSCIAGCQADGTETDRPGGTINQPTETERPTEPGNSIELLNHELTELGNGSLYIKGRGRNTSDQNVDHVRINGEFYSEDGTILKQSMGMVWHISPGESHVFRILFVGEEPERVEDYSLSLNVRENFPTHDNSGEIQLNSHEQTSFSDTERWGVFGVVENVSDQSFSEVEVYSHFYGSEKLVEFTGVDGVSNFDPGDRYEFQIYYSGNLNRGEIDRYELEVTYLE